MQRVISNASRRALGIRAIGTGWKLPVHRMSELPSKTRCVTFWGGLAGACYLTRQTWRSVALLAKTALWDPAGRRVHS